MVIEIDKLVQGLRPLFSSPNHGRGLKAHFYSAKHTNGSHIPSGRPCLWPLALRSFV